MSVTHSPTKDSTKAKTKAKTISMEGSSSSQPDLSRLGMPELESKSISLRKRKAPDSDFTFQLNEFKKEILGILKESSITQMESLNTMSQNITSSITEKLQEIKITQEFLMTENDNLKSQVASLTDTVNANKQQITSLQNQLQTLTPDLQMPPINQSALPTGYDDLILELQERTTRSKNIIIAGITERYSNNAAERREKDKLEAERIIDFIYPNCPKPIKIIRIGKYDESKTRPIKLCFDNQETAKNILRNKINLKEDSIRIYSDQTPYQQKLMLNLKTELKRRLENGETNLTIKYIKGIPKIVTQPKN